MTSASFGSPNVSAFPRKFSFLRLALFGAIATVVVTSVYLLLFWNHFVGLRSGAGEYGGGRAILAGYLPFRDFFTATPPLNALKSALELSIFGKAYIVSRACGVVERLFIALLVYGWLLRMFRASHAALAAIVTVILSSGDLSDPIASYNHDAVLFGIAAGFLASYVLDQFRSVRFVACFAVLSGFCAGLSASTKQTTGLGVTVAVPVIVCACLLKFEGFRKSVTFLLGFLVGWGLAAGLLLAWIADVGAMHAFLQAVFVSGPAAKASHPGDFLIRDVLILRINRWSALLSAILVATSWFAWRKSAAKEETRPDSLTFVVLALVIGLTGLAIGALYEPFTDGNSSRGFMKLATFYASFAVALLSFHFAFRWLLGVLTRRQSQFCLYAGVSFAIAIMLSLSFPLFELMMLPGLGLLIAALLDVLKDTKRFAVYALCVGLIAAETIGKMTVPFGFVSLSEPRVETAHSVSKLPLMKGFVLPESTVALIDGTVNIIEKNASPKDKIFTYPEFGFFYAITGRQCPTLTCSHNIDVVNDAFAESEAKRLLNNPPAVLIYKREPESAIKGDEIIWRSGKRSGNRAIIAAVEALASKYRLAGQFSVSGDPQPVLVMVR